MTTITINKGGAAEAQVELDTLQVPDLWHIANWVEGEAIRRRRKGDIGNGLDNQAKAILDTWHLAHDLLNHIRNQEPAPRTSWDACPECGCTDVEVSAWVNANTDEVINSEGPTDNAWCPQCEVNGLDGNMRSRDLVQVDEPKPFKNNPQGVTLVESLG
jgi:hypothetical protein